MSKRLPLSITGKSVYYDDTLKALVIHTKNSAGFENAFTYEKDSDAGASAWPITVIINNASYVLTEGFLNQHGVRLGDKISFAGSELPSPLSSGPLYYVVGLLGKYYWISATPTGAPITTLGEFTSPSEDRKILTYGLLDLDASDGAYATGDWVEILSSLMELYTVRAQSGQGLLDSKVANFVKSGSLVFPSAIITNYMVAIKSNYENTGVSPEPFED